MSQRLAEIRALPLLLARYREPDSARGAFELVITAVPFLVIWAVIQNALDHGYWLGLLLAVPAAGFLVRLFMIQHDCGHGSFFRNRAANDWVGRAIGVADPDALRFLATYPCSPSRQFGQSRSARASATSIR